MPYRCSKCNKLSANNSEEKCKNGKPCNFIQVEVIHLILPDGTGKPHSKLSDGTILNLCCDSLNPRPLATPFHHAATCLKCLATVPSAPELVIDDEVNKAIVDRTEENLNNIIGVQ